MINLLIAMMSDTYQRIQAQSDKEWKFGRAILIRQMNKRSATPSPINMLTKLYIVIKVAYWNRCKHFFGFCILFSGMIIKNFVIYPFNNFENN